MSNRRGSCLHDISITISSRGFVFLFHQSYSPTISSLSFIEYFRSLHSFRDSLKEVYSPEPNFLNQSTTPIMQFLAIVSLFALSAIAAPTTKSPAAIREASFESALSDLKNLQENGCSIISMSSHLGSLHHTRYKFVDAKN